MKQQQILIAAERGTRSVDGWGAGAWAFHKEAASGRYMIDHQPTGIGLGYTAKQTTARAICAHLQQAAPPAPASGFTFGQYPDGAWRVALYAALEQIAWHGTERGVAGWHLLPTDKDATP